MSTNPKIDLVRAIMQIEGNFNLSSTEHNKSDGSIIFYGYKDTDGETESIKISMDKSQVEAIMDCNSVVEIYNCYREMDYFNTVVETEDKFISKKKVLDEINNLIDYSQSEMDRVEGKKDAERGSFMYLGGRNILNSLRKIIKKL